VTPSGNMDRRVEEERIAMTVPCTSCGEPLHDHDLECRHCGTLAPPRFGATVFAPGNDETSVEPWSIPIRGPAVEHDTTDPVPVALPRPLVYGLVVIALLAGMVVLAGAMTGDGRVDETTDAASAQVDVAGDSVVADETTTTEARTTTSTSTPTTSTTSTSTSTTTTAPPPVSSGSVPTLSPSFRSGWVAQLTSVPVSAGAARLESAFAAVRADAPDAVATRSDEWPRLRPGYWVVVARGPFGSEDEVRGYCSSIGRTTDGCLPRLLSDRR
jgi:hypothetical protein